MAITQVSQRPQRSTTAHQITQQRDNNKMTKKNFSFSFSAEAKADCLMSQICIRHLVYILLNFVLSLRLATQRTHNREVCEEIFLKKLLNISLHLLVCCSFVAIRLVRNSNDKQRRHAIIVHSALPTSLPSFFTRPSTEKKQQRDDNNQRRER